MAACVSAVAGAIPAADRSDAPAASVSVNEVKQLFKRFRRLDRDNTGSIGREEFMNIPEFAINPLAPRVIAAFDVDHNDSVNFKQFVRVLSYFRPHHERESKLECTLAAGAACLRTLGASATLRAQSRSCISHV